MIEIKVLQKKWVDAKKQNPFKLKGSDYHNERVLGYFVLF